MARYVAGFALGTLAMLAASAPAEECAGDAADVVVKAHRFSDGRSYAYLVMNKGAAPIRSFYIGWGAFIDSSYSSEPVSIGSPSGWKGRHVVVPDPRQPESHSPRLIKYLWEAGDDSKIWIQPGRSLSGFSIQLPTPHESALAYQHFWKSRGYPAELPKDPPFEERLPPQPNLASVPFEALPTGGCPVVGTVELDGVPDADDS